MASWLLFDSMDISKFYKKITLLDENSYVIKKNQTGKLCKFHDIKERFDSLFYFIHSCFWLKFQIVMAKHLYILN